MCIPGGGVKKTLSNWMECFKISLFAGWGFWRPCWLVGENLGNTVLTGVEKNYHHP